MSEDLKRLIIAHKSGEAVELPETNLEGAENKSFLVKGAGTNHGRLEGGRLEPNGQTLIVNGEMLPDGMIPGVKRIWLTRKEGIFYDFTVHVEGACPKGMWSNKMHFTDASGDAPYSLSIISSSHKDHTVNYHSADGALVMISWDIS